MTAANEKPLPCPFCGGNARVYTDSYTRWQQSVCDGCGAKGPEVMAGCLPDAIAAWNRRAQTAELSTDDYMRLVEWMRSKPRRRANTAFTAGLLRSIAYAVEHAEQPATGSITATCETTSNLPYTVGQPAEAADGACGGVG